jgi:hypothetical protein
MNDRGRESAGIARPVISGAIDVHRRIRRILAIVQPEEFRIAQRALDAYRRSANAAIVRP